MKNIENIISHVTEFPTLPTIYTSLLETIANPRTTVQDIADLILRDQSSSAKILQVVNSSLFGLRTKVETISQAVFYIGFNEVKNIVLALSVMDFFKNPTQSARFNIVDLWKHSIAVGVIARLLGNRLGLKNIENYFITGIIHDIGKLLLFRVMKDDYLLLIERGLEKKLPLHIIENKVFGINHEAAGEMLAKKWKLPNSIIKSIRYHGGGISDSPADIQTSCVHLANIITQMLELGKSGNGIVPQPNFEIWKKLNFTKGDLAEMYDDIMINYEQSTGILTLKNH